MGIVDLGDLPNLIKKILLISLIVNGLEFVVFYGGVLQWNPWWSDASRPRRPIMPPYCGCCFMLAIPYFVWFTAATRIFKMELSEAALIVTPSWLLNLAFSLFNIRIL
ncbi:MAG: hypothetical protein EXR99_06760 [Gemmataceae bacterium]|nr:hypothetical protein [Gemmataceae bacterium]